MAKKEKQQAEPVQEATAPAAQQEQQPSLNLQDLILVAQIIQICSSRGAFKADELANVGNLYTKLVGEGFVRQFASVKPPIRVDSTQQ